LWSRINHGLVEVLEYALVVLVSSLVAGFSFGVYTGLASRVGPTTDEAAFASVVVLASAAVEHGSSSSTLVFANATIGCGPGAITFSTGTYSSSAPLPVDCSFAPQYISGTKQLTFDYSGGLLTLTVR